MEANDALALGFENVRLKTENAEARAALEPLEAALASTRKQLRKANASLDQALSAVRPLKEENELLAAKLAACEDHNSFLSAALSKVGPHSPMRAYIVQKREPSRNSPRALYIDVRHSRLCMRARSLSTVRALRASCTLALPQLETARLHATSRAAKLDSHLHKTERALQDSAAVAASLRNEAGAMRSRMGEFELSFGSLVKPPSGAVDGAAAEGATEGIGGRRSPRIRRARHAAARPVPLSPAMQRFLKQAGGAGDGADSAAGDANGTASGVEGLGGVPRPPAPPTDDANSPRHALMTFSRPMQLSSPPHRPAAAAQAGRQSGLSGAKEPAGALPSAVATVNEAPHEESQLTHHPHHHPSDPLPEPGLPTAAVPAAAAAPSAAPPPPPPPPPPAAAPPPKQDAGEAFLAKLDQPPAGPHLIPQHHPASRHPGGPKPPAPPPPSAQSSPPPAGPPPYNPMRISPRRDAALLPGGAGAAQKEKQLPALAPGRGAAVVVVTPRGGVEGGKQEHPGRGAGARQARGPKGESRNDFEERDGLSEALEVLHSTQVTALHEEVERLRAEVAMLRAREAAARSAPSVPASVAPPHDAAPIDAHAGGSAPID